MSLYSNMQICGECPISVERRDGTVWVNIKDGTQTLTMEAKHVRALWKALAVFENAEWAADHPTTHMVVDAAEPADAGVA